MILNGGARRGNEVETRGSAEQKFHRWVCASIYQTHRAHQRWQGSRQGADEVLHIARRQSEGNLSGSGSSLIGNEGDSSLGVKTARRKDVIGR